MSQVSGIIADVQAATQVRIYVTHLRDADIRYRTSYGMCPQRVRVYNHTTRQDEFGEGSDVTRTRSRDRQDTVSYQVLNS